MSVKIVMPGAMTTIQDGGRRGFQEYGIAASGVMDRQAYRRANYLAGNPGGEAVLEAVLFGGAMEFTADTVIAVTGADMEPKRGEEPLPMNRPVLMKEGDILNLGMAKSGCRTYIAFAGGIDVPPVMGSRSTNVKCRVGGIEGRPLKAGDIFETGEAAAAYEEIKDRTVKAPAYSADITVRVIGGPQEECFTKNGRDTFYGGAYTISDQSDRMGYRMKGPAVESINGTDIISDGIPFGAVQIPADGEPIVLLADRQTTGGYAKIAVVCSFDIPLIVQGKPGDKVRFKKISVEEAQKINQEQRNVI